MNDAVLNNLTSPPKVGSNKLYRWCDYIELRCVTHIDKRFSRDSLSEAIEESKDIDKDDSLSDTSDESLDAPEGDDEGDGEAPDDTSAEKDRHEEHSAFCFKHLRWRAVAFGDAWPFEIDEHAQEIRLRAALTTEHRFYLSLLLSASLSYVPRKKWRDLTGLFERASIEIITHLMPRGAEVHAFGAAETKRYTGHLFDRLTTLARDVNGHLLVKKQHFDPHDSGDSGLDIVAWHDLGDGREGMPIAFAQCGCTAEGWPDKMLQASPMRLGGTLTTRAEWSTYYFMPLDLSIESADKMDWQYLSDFSKAIVIDRLRFMRLSANYAISKESLTADRCVDEALAFSET